jgi:hypothetical protein
VAVQSLAKNIQVRVFALDLIHPNPSIHRPKSFYYYNYV